MPDLIQTEHVPNSRLARPTKKSIKNKTQKMKSHGNCIKIHQTTGHMTEFNSKFCQKTGRTKQNTKKCQPAAGDMPDLIQTEHVPNSWLARPKKIK